MATRKALSSATMPRSRAVRRTCFTPTCWQDFAWCWAWRRHLAMSRLARTRRLDLWALLERIPRDCWPTLLRGDSGIASEGMMREAEGRELDYLFKLKLTKNVKRLIERTFMKGGWRDAGQGWQGKMETLRLTGWSRQRDVVVLR